MIAALLVLTSACSNTKYCEREQEYQNVYEGQPLRAPEGLEVPEPDPSYVVPELSTQAKAAAVTKSRPCLEIPPRLRSQTVVEEEGA